jgi:3-oxoacyl-[acyl-carrier protein] reductase
VTGGSRGIGRTVAVMLASEGAAVLVVGRDDGRLSAVAAECERAGAGRAARLVLDITEPTAGERLAAACRDLIGEAEVLVNNAGTITVRALEELTEEDWQVQWELNVMGPMRLMRALVPAMAERGFGRVVNVSTSSGKRPGQRNVAYSVTKAAELSLSRAYADAYAARGVLINAVTPGPVGSELWLGAGGIADQLAKAQGISREQVLERTAGGVPLGRFGTEDEIASVITFLCSAHSYVTGAAWSVDGGAVPVII